ncbi:hypothetical protein C8J56DRAFT_1064396 [Mycena floridula]|nr:hypothetical protein C8J56DRAFT_1064396 [Mycena floridula]
MARHRFAPVGQGDDAETSETVVDQSLLASNVATVRMRKATQIGRIFRESRFSTGPIHPFANERHLYAITDKPTTLHHRVLITPYGLLPLYGMPKSPGFVSEMRSRRDESRQKWGRDDGQAGSPAMDDLVPKPPSYPFSCQSQCPPDGQRQGRRPDTAYLLQKRHFAHHLTSIIPIPIPMLSSELTLCRLMISLNAAQLPWYLWLKR